MDFKELAGSRHSAIKFQPGVEISTEELKKEFNIPENLEPIMMITLGKSVQDRERPRGYRKPLGELVKFEKY